MQRLHPVSIFSSDNSRGAVTTAGGWCKAMFNLVPPAGPVNRQQTAACPVCLSGTGPQKWHLPTVSRLCLSASGPRRDCHAPERLTYMHTPAPSAAHAHEHTHTSTFSCTCA